MPRKINRIIIHTSASYNILRGVLDPSAKDIDRMHRARGWNGIGYHRVIRRNGVVEFGRDDDMAGAGVAWANSDTLHVCCTGSGDHADFTEEQKESLAKICHMWLKKHGILDAFRKNPFRILGHKEINVLVTAGLYPERARTTKSCPGKKVSMEQIRERIYRHVAKAEGW
jgi:N-acetylmuramoyl-L-alanine amidase